MADNDTNRPEGETDASDSDPEQKEEIRDKVREMTSQVLKGGRLDPKGVEEVVRTITTGADSGVQQASEQARQALLDTLPALEEQLTASAAAARTALERLGAKGQDFTENDVKEAFAMLRELQSAYAETVHRLADAASGNIQRELRDLVGHAQQFGTDAGARAASVMTEFANRLGSTSREGATTGIGAVRDASVRMSLLASGVLAGIADALREQPRTGKDE